MVGMWNFMVNWCVSVLSHFSPVWHFSTLWTIAHQGSLSLGFSRILQWVAMPSSRGSSQPRGQTNTSCVFGIAGRFFTPEPLGMPGKLGDNFKYSVTSSTPWEESYDQPIKHIKKQRYYFANKGLSSQGYGFSSGHVWMWELDYEESWAPKNWCFWTVVLEKTLVSPLNCKEIQPVHPKGDRSWVFIGRTDAEAETPILCPSHAKSRLIGKDPDAGLGAGGEGDDRGRDDWMASLTRWMWVWVNSGSWWWTGRPGVLWFTGLQRVGHNWVTELNWGPQNKHEVFSSSCE